MNCGFPADTRWVRSPCNRGTWKPEGHKKLTFSSMCSVVLSRFLEWSRHWAGLETGVALAKLRWIRRTRMAKKRRPEREMGRGGHQSSLSAWFGLPLSSAILAIFAIHFLWVLTSLHPCFSPFLGADR